MNLEEVRKVLPAEAGRALEHLSALGINFRVVESEELLHGKISTVVSIIADDSRSMPAVSHVVKTADLTAKGITLSFESLLRMVIVGD